MTQRALLAVAGLALGLLLLEGALRAAALCAPALLGRGGDPEVDSAPGEIRIVCVGDSHTYGVGVAARDAYPAELGRILHARGVPARVTNLGIPGQTSSQLRHALPTELARHRPDVVIVWTGANNQWRAEDVAPSPAEPAPSSWLDRLRIVRLVRLLAGRWEGVSGDFRREIGQHAGGGIPVRLAETSPDRAAAAEAAATTERADLPPIVELVRGAGATPVLLTYPVAFGPVLGRLDEIVVEIGAHTGTLVVDLRGIAQRLIARRVPGLLLPDLHPSPRLYRAIAWDVARALARHDLLAPGVGARPRAGAARRVPAVSGTRRPT